ncbi:hypothetical protein ACP70R_001309 [Stipagrostis hirtigluma subsp. patula]
MASRGEGKGPGYPQYAAPYGGGYGAAAAAEEEERRWWPWLVPTLLVACVAVFAAEMFVNDCPRHGSPGGRGCVAAGLLRRFSFQPLRENPLLGPSSATVFCLQKMGALNWAKVVHEHQGWRLISCIWLHAGLVHLIVNMLSLLFIGIRLEQQFGFAGFECAFTSLQFPHFQARIGVIYMLSGFGGSVLSALFLRGNYISVGASGALFGLLGSMLSELIMNWTIYSNKIAAIITLLFIIAVNLAIGMLPHADNFAHIGGFAAGFLLGFVLLARPQFGWMEGNELPQTNQPPKYKAYQYVLWVAALILLVVGICDYLGDAFQG